MADSPKVVLCNDCKMWFDAQLAACPSCERERPDENKALMTARLNGALATQMNYARADAAAESQFRQARNTGNADLANRPLSNYPGYKPLVQSIKQKIAESGLGT